MECASIHSAWELDEERWATALAREHTPVSLSFLRHCERYGSVDAAHGWMPFHLELRADGRRAYAPAYVKAHSWGEFVFDQQWADLHERVGLSYYPKLLVASPLTPVTGPRLLCGGADELREAMATGIREMAREQFSSAHVNFVNHADATALAAQGFFARHDCHFRWTNRGYADFDEFLGALRSSRRRMIRKERRRVQRLGLSIQCVEGSAATAAQWLAMHRFYQATFERKWNLAMFGEDWFRRLPALGENVLLVLASDDDRTVAGALYLKDRDQLFGRYWGADVDYSGLHFELCYYQGIDYCIRHGIRRFDPGVQGYRHKFPRGFEPERTTSMHYLAHPDLHRAVAAAVAQEARQVDANLAHLRATTPYATLP